MIVVVGLSYTVIGTLIVATQPLILVTSTTYTPLCSAVAFVILSLLVFEYVTPSFVHFHDAYVAPSFGTISTSISEPTQYLSAPTTLTSGLENTSSTKSSVASQPVAKSNNIIEYVAPFTGVIVILFSLPISSPSFLHDMIGIDALCVKVRSIDSPSHTWRNVSSGEMLYTGLALTSNVNSIVFDLQPVSVSTTYTVTTLLPASTPSYDILLSVRCSVSSTDQ